MEQEQFFRVLYFLTVIIFSSMTVTVVFICLYFAILYFNSFLDQLLGLVMVIKNEILNSKTALNFFSRFRLRTQKISRFLRKRKNTKGKEKWQ